MKTRMVFVTVSAIAAALLTGCGGGSSSDTSTATNLQTGYFVDAAIANADYDCVAEGSMNKKTGPDGSFQCQNMTQVRFRLGELVLGEVASVPADRYVFPQDLVGVARENVNDARVTAMAQLLQSLDTDGNPANGITIAQNEKEAIAEARTNFSPHEVPVYLESASVPPTRTKTAAQAREHLKETVQYVAGEHHASDAAQEASDTAQHASETAGQAASDAAHHAGETAQNAASDAMHHAEEAAH